MKHSHLEKKSLLPEHIAIIMDGNGRWAKQRLLPRIAGHKQGRESVRAVVGACNKKNIKILTLFAFSSENWNRPKSEIDFLLGLFLGSLTNEIQELHKNNVRLKIIGERKPFSLELQQAMENAENCTAENTGLLVNLALNFGGRWDIVQAASKIAECVAAGNYSASDITEELFQDYLSLGSIQPPDLLIRTSGEQRISNFLLWDLAYTELYFTNTFWPDFREVEFEKALEVYAKRSRRFGLVSVEEEVEAFALDTLTA